MRNKERDIAAIMHVKRKNSVLVLEGNSKKIVREIYAGDDVNIFCIEKIIYQSILGIIWVM